MSDPATLAARPEPPAPVTSIRHAVVAFHRTIEGIRGLLATVTPHLEEESTQLRDALKRMRSNRQRVAAMIFFHAVGTRTPGNSPEESGRAVEATPGWVPDDLRDAFEAAAHGRLEERDLEALMEREFEGEISRLLEFSDAMQGTLYDPDRKLLLNSSILVTAVATFETLLARLLATQLRTFPALLDASERTFTLADLQEFDSVEDARHAAIQDRVAAIMRESFQDWEKWFAKKANVQMADCCIDRDAVSEVIQRRHLFVHSGGRVSKQYLERLGLEEPPIGTPLKVDDAYLQRALDELDVVGVGLGLTLAVAWGEDDRRETVSGLNRIAFQLLRAGRWRAAQRMSEVGVTLEPGDAWLETAMKVNAWIARKHVDGLDAIRSEVGSWDVSALAPEFGLAKVALLDDHDRAFELLAELLAAGTITLESLTTWPLFLELRADPRFAELTTSLGEDPEPLESAATTVTSTPSDETDGSSERPIGED